MKRLKEIFNSLNEMRKQLEDQITQSNAFNLLKERYESLSLFSQSLIKKSLIGFLLLILIFPPASYFLSSVKPWQELKNNQTLSSDIFKMRQQTKPDAFKKTKIELEALVKSVVERYAVDFFSVEEILEKNKKRLGRLSSFQFEVQVKAFNVKQAISLAAELKNLPQMKLQSLRLEENKEYPKRYDVKYGLSSFVLSRGAKKQNRERVRSKREKNKKEDMKKEGKKERLKRKPLPRKRVSPGDRKENTSLKKDLKKEKDK